MQEDTLATYLNDHLAGSVMAIELLEHLEEDGGESPARQRAMRDLRQKIIADQDILRVLLNSLPSGESTVKKAGAWVMEKLARAKTKLTKTTTGCLGALEAFEILSLGIEGKKCLWKVLTEVMPQPPSPQWNWRELIEDADRQRREVEAWRIEAARKAFLEPPAGHG
ncbi:MAG: hypothetical protein ACO1TE_20180 [Prosthecobacter sp.]